ncbi:hypothetical protein THASP1DRAFT_25971 [Thamnocephalis sphaerospora]|uniref:Arrestin-like N-terminal domain-containing protein n=1 Tax=Thamnocephalis sphaerospora TaxID=78915 RepID=A0A4P9XIL9_9FUNG|nr:hypothetical protein THASP1DRAFT_25971 [Thamnocephalis sphaerospora]|eukprot:RKP05554.1 hypothetical protein THASP1DRAFT_25971 [Thamnocephalis sphaerospora]
MARLVGTHVLGIGGDYQWRNTWNKEAKIQRAATSPQVYTVFGLLWTKETKRCDLYMDRVLGHRRLYPAFWPGDANWKPAAWRWMQASCAAALYAWPSLHIAYSAYWYLCIPIRPPFIPILANLLGRWPFGTSVTLKSKSGTTPRPSTAPVALHVNAYMLRSPGFSILLDEPHTVYHPGDTIKGVVELVLSRPIRTREIRVRLRGSLQVFVNQNHNVMELFTQEVVVWSASSARPALSTVSLGGSTRHPLGHSEGTSSVHPPHYLSLQHTHPADEESAEDEDSATVREDTAEDERADPIEICDDGESNSDCGSASDADDADCDQCSISSQGHEGTAQSRGVLATLSDGANSLSSGFVENVIRGRLRRMSLMTVLWRRPSTEEAMPSALRQLRRCSTFDEMGELRQGLHRFPFQITLPAPNTLLPELPSTFYESLTFVRYELAATYSQPWPWARRTTSLDLVVQPRNCNDGRHLSCRGKRNSKLVW